MIAVLNRDPKTIAEIIAFIAEHQDDQNALGPNKPMTSGHIRKMYGLSHDEWETIMTLALPAMKWNTKYRSIKMKKKEEAKKEAKNEPAA